MKGLIKLLVPVATLALVFQAQAATYKISLTKEVTESKSVYQKQDVTSDEYDLISSYQEYNTKLRGEGPFSRINQTKYGEVDEDVIGLDIKGHSKIKLSMVGGQLYVTADMLVDDVLEGVHFYLPVKFSAPAKFVKGNWDEFKAGQDVEVEYTAEGKKLAMEAVVEKVKYAFRIVNKALKTQLADADFTDVTLDKMEFTGSGKIKANSHRVEVISAPVTIKVSFGVSM